MPVVRPEHCEYCFDTLLSHLDPVVYPKPAAPTFPDDEYPLFVTWNHQSRSGHLRLRGCIGTFSGVPLHEGLASYALTSALKDRRFSPIRLAEVPKLACSVSLLTNFEEGKSAMDWELGTHGIWIEFHDTYGVKRTATYLPEIALEQGWSKIEALDSLLRKGGYQGKITDAVRYGIHLTRYQSQKTALTYQEYLDRKTAAAAV
ncbi:hypothetical protein H4R34_003013 [Dimargaris verticillata]|uniref:AMMECR1 domain-containing protein n=1 Tax=Dimargaris verticillata TaxID=2761393 RepID=A0A9W8B0T2_9FUNG|nr:hypothetical protein H4R34_003013 [Dimargaris verticillata]